MTGTAALTKPLCALLMGVASSPVATESIDAMGSFPIAGARYAFIGGIPSTPTTAALPSAPNSSFTSTTASDLLSIDVLNRETTLKEHTIGELRRWKSLAPGWDGDQAQAPIAASLQDAISFVRLLKDSVSAEPMLHPTGRAGLFWQRTDLYADLEFLGGRRVAYFIERSGDKHKGVVNFDAMEMPAVLEAVLPS
jgi:hypothetical protein